MEDDTKSPPSSRLGKALRVGKRMGARAGRLIRSRRVGTPEVPTEPVMVVIERAKGSEVSALQPGGISLLAAAVKMGVQIDHFCGGQCSCGTCRIEIIEGAQRLSPQDGREQMVLGAANVASGNRLACQARVLGPVRVRVPQWF